MTPGVPPTTHAGWLPTNVYPLLLATAGLRSAATLPGSLSGNPSGTPDMVVLAGPALETALGINLFVFNATTHAYIGSFSLPQYSDIRKYVTYQGITGSGIMWLLPIAPATPTAPQPAEAFCCTRAFKTTRIATTALRSSWSACCPAKGPTLLRIWAGFTSPPGRAK